MLELQMDSRLVGKRIGCLHVSNKDHIELFRFNTMANREDCRARILDFPIDKLYLGYLWYQMELHHFFLFIKLFLMIFLETHINHLQFHIDYFWSSYLTLQYWKSCVWLHFHTFLVQKLNLFLVIQLLLYVFDHLLFHFLHSFLMSFLSLFLFWFLIH